MSERRRLSTSATRSPTGSRPTRACPHPRSARTSLATRRVACTRGHRVRDRSHLDGRQHRDVPRQPVPPLRRRGRPRRTSSSTWCACPRPSSTSRDRRARSWTRRMPPGPEAFARVSPVRRGVPSAVSHRAARRAGRLAGRDLLERDVLVAGVRQRRVARAEVEGRDAEPGEPRDIGPAELGPRRLPHGADEVGRRGPIQSGQRAGGGVDHVDLEAVEDLPRCATPPPRLAIRREPVVDGHDALVRDDVAGDPSMDPHCAEALAVLQAVDHRPARLVCPQPIEDSDRPRGWHWSRATIEHCVPARRWQRPRLAGCPGSPPRSPRSTAPSGSPDPPAAGRDACSASAAGR